ncbi:Lactococcin-G-processing and transport ATP-binding protein lagD [Fibrella aestuarina BUZ 2]|uniref:Lactococcin-G-processing and transport ATP-binding protein lagD n=1 Tax=Fibrella aestuarina BUZ 2 TaxID=1166018 RepID=I0KBK8_9BACT|nr:peptidase domain-containing ABC transporter [Fibrella aestuarina]CCH01511.1 Lactococcin-G-processing and transport ATP-binding protein lagD [Fibrella aestuarina BUZ 2]
MSLLNQLKNSLLARWQRTQDRLAERSLGARVRVKQRDLTDCGAACLASVASYYRLVLPVARIRQIASTDQKGTTMLGMVEAAQKLDFQAKGVKATYESLSKIPLPAIAHVNVLDGRMQHYVVVYRITPQHVTVMDPSDGQMHTLTPEQFKAAWTGLLVLLIPDETFKIGNEKVPVLQRFWRLMQPHRAVMGQALFGALIYTILGLSSAIYIQKIVDNVLVNGNRNLLNLLSITMILLLFLQIFINATRSFFNLKTGQRIDAALILGYYKHLMTLPQSFFDTMRVGEVISRVNDAVKIRTFINEVGLGLLVNVLIVFFSFGLMFTYYWKLALILILVVPFYAAIYWAMNRFNQRYQRKLMENSADLEAQLVESLNAMPTIKRFGLEQFASQKTENRFVMLLQTIFQTGSAGIYAGNASEFVTRLFTIILLWAGAGYVLGGDLTPGELLSFYALIGYFTGPAASLIGANRPIQEALIAADRLFEIMDLDRESNENKVQLRPDMVGDIRFQGVTFRYGSRAPVFDNLTLTMPKGKITALVGESGSGKSTMLSLVQGLYPIQEGSIFIGEYDIKHLHSDSLRRVVSVVPQKIDLFAGDVVENIAIGEEDPDMERILSICGSLGITDFIERMPNGFKTYLGENGATLSGGQKQRLAIARALYRDPEVLILDEATSALDSASEQYVQQTVQQLRKAGKTIIIIAHRLSTVRKADKIVVLEQGRVVEEGKHNELLKSGKIYSQFWQQQTELV